MAISTKSDIRIDQALENHPLIRGKNVQIQRTDRRVILEGGVSSFYHKQMLQEMIRRLDGVEEIENRLLVDWTHAAEEQVGESKAASQSI